MKNLKWILLAPMFCVLFSCFEHEDDVTIYKSGVIELVSTIVVTADDSDKKEVKEDIEEKVEALKKAGWKVSYKWKKKSKPFKIEFKASNTLNKLYDYQKRSSGENPSGVYITKKFTETQYVVSFDMIEDADNRILNVNANSLSFYSPNGDDGVKETRHIDNDKNYYVFLD